MQKRKRKKVFGTIAITVALALTGCAAIDQADGEATAPPRIETASKHAVIEVPDEEQHIPSGGAVTTAAAGGEADPLLDIGRQHEEHNAKRIKSYNQHPKTVHYKNKVEVLVYHHLDDKESMVTITPKKFRDHLKALKDNQYNIISMEEYLAFMKDGKDVPPNAVVLTFDDGYESFYKHAFPALKEAGAVATNFLIVSYVDTDYPQLPFLKWEQVKEMKKAGMSFYSHTYDLHNQKPDQNGEVKPVLTNRVAWKEKQVERAEEYRKRVLSDLLLAEQLLKEQLGPQQPLLCFPYGAYNDNVVQMAKDIGINYMFTVKEGINTQQTREIYRINAGQPFVTGDVLIQMMKKYK